MNHETEKAGHPRFPGVHWHKKAKKWVAQIRVNNAPLYLGLHVEFCDAVSPSLAR